MRYLVRARLKPDCQRPLLEAIRDGTLGQGSIAEGEYLRNMHDAVQYPDGTTRWVEVCYCPTPLEEERPYWEQFFDLVKIHVAHARRNCRDENGTEPWACGECDCSRRLEDRLATEGWAFLRHLD